MCIHLKVQSFENILLRLWLLKLQYLYLFMVYIEFFCDLHLLPSNPNFFLTFLAHLPQLGSSGLQCSSPNHRFVYSCRQVPLVKEKQLKLCEIFYSHEIIPLRQPTYLFLPTNQEKYHYLANLWVSSYWSCLLANVLTLLHYTKEYLNIMDDLMFKLKKRGYSHH